MRKSAGVGVEVYWPPSVKLKKPIGSCTPSDSLWLTMCGMAELWPTILPELFPYLSVDLRKIVDGWISRDFGETPLVDLLWHQDAPHRAVVERWRQPVTVGDSPPSPVRRPHGLKFIHGERPVQVSRENLARLGNLIPEAIRVDRVAADTVQVSIQYDAIRDCMVHRMGELPARVIGYTTHWHGKWASLFEAERPVDATLKVVR